MSERRILVIGSQCEALGQLGFLPQAAWELYQVMIDPERGACVSALEGAGLIIDPSVNDTKDAIKKAYHRAARDEATLFIAYMTTANGRTKIFTCSRGMRKTRLIQTRQYT